MKILVGADGAPLPPDPQTPGFSLGMEWYPLRAFGFDLPGGAWDKGGQTMGYVHYWQYFPERDFIITTATDVVSDASLRNAYFGIEVFNYLLITRKI